MSCWKGPSLQKPKYFLGCRREQYSGPYSSWPSSMTCQSTKHSNARLFANDCLLYRHVTSSQDSALLQEDLSELERWEDTWQMKFHPERCTVIRISTNRRQIIKTNYQIHGYTLEIEDLTWKKHIDNTVNKANKTLSFIWRNLGDCTAPVKSAAYTTVVRDVLKYSSTVWDPHQTSDVHNLKQVQHRAAHFVHRNYTEQTPECVTNMVQSLGWESLQHRWFTGRLSMLFRIQNGLINVTTDYIQPNDTRTRGSQRLHQLQATKDIYKYFFYPRTISDWNRLPTSVTDVQTLQEFRKGSQASLPYSCDPTRKTPICT